MASEKAQSTTKKPRTGGAANVAEPTSQRRLRLERLEITNLKGIDHLEIEFPEPRWPGEADIHVLGSANGVGKTTVLEAAALAFLCSDKDGRWLKGWDPDDLALDFGDYFCRAGESSGQATAVFGLPDGSARSGFRCTRHGRLVPDVGDDSAAPLQEYVARDARGRFNSRDPLAAIELLRALLGYSAEPVLVPGLVCLHSYRRMTEGGIELGALVSGGERRPGRAWRMGTPMSAFKMEALRAKMASAGLFERLATEQPSEILPRLDDLLGRFAGCKLAQLRPSESNQVELRVTPLASTESFSFDALSSGQKEIIGTLFQIWLHTKDTPAIVLIDEPELHLNGEWHAEFVRALTDLAPQNQYILATHSRSVFAAVPEERRLMLQPAVGRR
ncbi:MAG: AAA family ATPase [Fimbriimonadaceae bacterium]|nr:AAA family ATPase [Fimbriimonadaceae bacterium]